MLKINVTTKVTFFGILFVILSFVIANLFNTYKTNINNSCLIIYNTLYYFKISMYFISYLFFTLILAIVLHIYMIVKNPYFSCNCNAKKQIFINFVCINLIFIFVILDKYIYEKYGIKLINTM